MTSKEPVMIDSAWERPYLVYWNKRQLRRTGAIEIQVDGKWIGVKNLRPNSFRLDPGSNRSSTVQRQADDRPLHRRDRLLSTKHLVYPGCKNYSKF